jgi:2-oxoglutarate dehydrogenase E1 component
VINNHLARGRGGKVSFTHIIGYAMVKALASHPEMNNSFAVATASRLTVTPDAVNLGIAIDLAKPDGTRTLVVPSIKAPTGWTSGSSGSPTRTSSGAPPQRADDGRLRRHHDLADQPGRHRHRALDAAAHAGQGTIIGVGAMEHPAEFAGMSDDQLADSPSARSSR